MTRSSSLEALILDRHEHAEVEQVDEVAPLVERDPLARQAGTVLDHERRELERPSRAEREVAEERQRRADAEEQLLLKLMAAHQADRGGPPAVEEPPAG